MKVERWSGGSFLNEGGQQCKVERWDFMSVSLEVSTWPQEWRTS